MSRPYDPESFPSGVFEARGPAPVPEPAGEAIDLKKYLNALRRHWLTLVICVVVVVAFALVRYSLTTKEYRATTVIQIERKRLAYAAMGGDTWLENWWNLEYYPTQYRLLRSRGMAERVVLDLRLYENPTFTGGRVVQLPDLDGVGVGDPELEAEVNAALARLAAKLQAGFEVNPIKETQLVELSYDSSSPELAALIANGYAQAFIAWGAETRQGTVDRASKFLSQQIETLSRDIEAQRQKLNEYGRESDLALDPAGELIVERREMLEKQYNQAVSTRIGKEVAYQDVLDLSAERVADRYSDGRVSRLKSELVQLRSEYEAQLDVYRPEWPAMVELKEQIDAKQRELDSAVREDASKGREQIYGELQKARLEEAALEEALRSLNAESLDLNSDAIEYNNLKTVIRTRQELLNDLVKRQSETEVASQIQSSVESNVRIVDRAIVPGAPFRPLLRQELTMALGLGFLLGLAGIALREYLDRTIKTPEELESIMGLPTLTVVPDLGGKSRSKGYGGYGYGYGRGRAAYGYAQPTPARGGQGGGSESERRIELLPHHHPRLAVCEAYRSLRTALLLSSAEELKVVAITSAEPSEGKTATAANVAVVMAQLGRRVLVVDADLRRPRMHKVFGISNRLGLVSYLTRGVEAERVIVETQVPNLFVCPSGPIPPNPSELLASERMRELLATARARFDFVVLDTPPTLAVVDAVILGIASDGLVICARAGQLVREDAKACRDQLRFRDLRIFGTVLNRYHDDPTRYRKRSRYYEAYEEAAPAGSAESTAA